ncbi:protein Pry1p [Monosporozyma unispora]|nr:hypothetical protein C6P44_005004 [Kazachstania unispora]
MQFSKLSLLSVAATSVLAAPAVVTVTQQQQATVVVRGAVYVTDGQTYTTYITDNAPQPTPTTAAAAPVAEDQYFNENAAPAATASAATAAVDVNVAQGTTTVQPAAQAPTTTQQDHHQHQTAETTQVTPATTTTQAAASTDNSNLSDNASVLLNAHNNKRALHQNTPSLTWSSELEAYAQNYANGYDCSGNLIHSGGPYGENLALGYGVEGAVEAWYGEISDYDFSNPGFSENAGHFTQLIWKSSTEVGCAIKSCGGSWGDYVICSYNPAGNVIGEFPENVLPLV